jgi:hypothetical protein
LDMITRRTEKVWRLVKTISTTTFNRNKDIVWWYFTCNCYLLPRYLSVPGRLDGDSMTDSAEKPLNLNVNLTIIAVWDAYKNDVNTLSTRE